MVCFEPADSGINSILGQMMWFKRFCTGHGIDFEFGLDLDHSRRNSVTSSIHELFFGRNLKRKAVEDFDETIGLNAFFRDVVSGRFRLAGKKVRVVSGENNNPGEPGLWRSHAFHLHCLERGFLADRFPYWAEDLSEFMRDGAIARSGRLAPAGRKSKALLTHLRLGDIVAIPTARIAEILGTPVPGAVLATGRIMSEADWDLYRMGMLGGLPPRHYAERAARLVSVEAMANMIAGHQARTPELEVVFATDGYSRAAQWLAGKINLPAEAIEKAFNAMLDPITSLVSRSYIGETGDSLSEVLWSIAEADRLVTTASLFPLTVKCALIGRQALDGWTMIDESDTLSQYLHLPTAIDHSLVILEAQLRRLAIAEPVSQSFPTKLPALVSGPQEEAIEEALKENRDSPSMTQVIPDTEKDMGHVQIGDIVLSFRDRDGSDPHCLKRGHSEEYHSRLYSILRVTLDPSVCIDIGANYGYTGLLMRRAFPDCHMTLVEPVPWREGYIRYNFAQNNMHFDRFESAICSVPTESNRSTFGVRPNNSQEYRVVPPPGAEAIETGVVTLDQLTSRIGSDDGVYIKIDTQGWEQRVFEGGEGFMARHHKWFAEIEFAPEWLEIQGTNPVVFLEWLMARYEIHESAGRVRRNAAWLADVVGRPLIAGTAAVFVDYVRNLALNDKGRVHLYVLPPAERRAYSLYALDLQAF